MTDYFAANDVAAFVATAGSISESTTGPDTTYTSKAIAVSGTSVGKSTQFINPTTGANVSLTDAWFHWDMTNQGSGSAGSDALNIANASGTPIFRIFYPGSTTVRLDYWNGAAWVVGGSTFAAHSGNTNRQTFDLHLVAGLAGSANLYVGGVLALTLTGLNAAVDNFAFLLLKGGGFSSAADYSQFLVSDLNTIGAKVASLTPTATGTNAAWANDFNAIVEQGVNDATFISSGTVGDKTSFVASDAAVPAGYEISSVWFAIRARQGPSAPTNIKPLVRVLGADYVGGYNFQGLNNTTFGPSIACIPTDPTGGAWGATNVNAAEPGFQSAT